MKTLAANVNGDIPNVGCNDLYLDGFGNIVLSYDQNAILEQCAQAAKTQLGELVFNTDVGIPYRETLWVGVPKTQQFRSALTDALLSVQGVLELVSLITSQGGEGDGANDYRYTAIIRTVFGTGVVSG